MRVLVVGGAGYLGSHVVRYLAPQAKVTVYDNLLYRDEYLEQVDFVYGDVQDVIRLNIQLKQSDVVLWLAAIVGDTACSTNPAVAHQVNVDALERATDFFHGPLIFLSTASVYGFYDGLATEDTPFNPQSLYAETKVKAEAALANRANTLILRLATLHGPSPRMRFDLAVNVMTRDAVLNNSVTVHGGSQWRPLASVLDVAHFIYCNALKTPMLTGTYNVVSENVQIQHVADTICSLTGAQQNTIQTHVEDRRDYHMSGDKLGNHYRPVIMVEDSVREIKCLIKEGRFKDPYASKYVNQKALQGMYYG